MRTEISYSEARVRIPWHPDHVMDCVSHSGDYMRFGASEEKPIIFRIKGNKMWKLPRPYSVICKVTDFGNWEETLRGKPK